MQVAFVITRQRVAFVDVTEDEYQRIMSSNDSHAEVQNLWRDDVTTLEDVISEAFDEAEAFTIDGIRLATKFEVSWIDVHPARESIRSEALNNAPETER